MKFLKIHILSTLLFLLASLTANAQQITAASLQVTGLTCSMCSQATEKSLRTLDFIVTVSPDLNNNVFVLTFKKDKPVNLDQIRKKVKDAGFSVGKLEADFAFNNLQVDESGFASSKGTAFRFSKARNTTLNGKVRAAVIDRGFVSEPTFKQNLKKIDGGSYASGTATVNGKKVRVYHLSI
ncbi:heavy-metal-associated domain-containing protein [Pedobacter sp. SYP-B3415]|uniref:heavy-metal-associated domain-containing protein n=1 Tax=Pedobacter sp. SYP-B3415 TaxID=2496641 RepID=UPI00101B7B86|nr:cation transporter [Pedobacter sp. SYP-B3415]